MARTRRPQQAPRQLAESRSSQAQLVFLVLIILGVLLTVLSIVFGFSLLVTGILGVLSGGFILFSAYLNNGWDGVKSWGTILFALIALGVAVYFIVLIVDVGVDVGSAAEERTGLFSRAMARLQDMDLLTELNPFVQLERLRERTVRQVREDAFTATVDENIDPDLGLEMDALESFKQAYEPDEIVEVFTNLKVKTLDKELVAEIDCKTKEGQEATTIKPATILPFIGSGNTRVSCLFDDLEAGKAHIIEMESTFNFNTLSYLRTFFVDIDTKRELSREGDPNFVFADKFNILDAQPDAVSTGGPVTLGMGIDDNPIAFDQARPLTYTLGVTVNNDGRGEITRIKDFIVLTPKGFSVTGASGAEVIEPLTCDNIPAGEMKDGCLEEVNRAYRVRLYPNTVSEKDPIKDFRVFTVELQPLAGSDVLQRGEPYTVHNFKVELEYDYVLKGDINVFKRKRTEVTQ